MFNKIQKYFFVKLSQFSNRVLAALYPYRALRFFIFCYALIKQKLFWLIQPDSGFKRNGFFLEKAFLDKKSTERLLNYAKKFEVLEDNYFISDKAYFLCRRKLESEFKKYDENTKQLFNVQDINEDVRNIFLSGKIQSAFERYLNIKLDLLGITFQYDDIDTHSRQPWHVDQYFPVTFKSFLYLDSVDSLEEGPYCIIPGSHRHVFKKLASCLVNWVKGENETHMHYVYKDKDCHPFLAQAGDCVFSAQTAVHKGWHDHQRKRRYLMVCYLAPKGKSTSPLKLGVNHVKRHLKDELSFELT